MDMPVKAVYANPAVRQLVGPVAMQRGPIVYCLEGVDNGDIALDRISLDPAEMEKLHARAAPDLLGGVTVVRGKACAWMKPTRSGARCTIDNSSSKQPSEITAIPYCVWDNRAPGEMRVWFRVINSVDNLLQPGRSATVRACGAPPIMQRREKCQTSLLRSCWTPTARSRRFPRCCSAASSSTWAAASTKASTTRPSPLADERGLAHATCWRRCASRTTPSCATPAATS